MSVIVGIDEVGRGCWAGPLVAAAVVLNRPVEGLKDSKLLSAHQRKNLAEAIQANGHIGLGWVQADEIDKIGLTAATTIAMSQALDQIRVKYDEIIMDGHINFLPELQVTTIIKADKTIPSVSAASIVAKVARDQYMHVAAIDFPYYGFDKHVGYGTKFHHEMLKIHGLCNLHRRSFKPLQQILANSL